MFSKIRITEKEQSLFLLDELQLSKYENNFILIQVLPILKQDDCKIMFWPNCTTLFSLSTVWIWEQTLKFPKEILQIWPEFKNQEDKLSLTTTKISCCTC